MVLNFMDSKEDILQQWLDKGKDELRSAEYLCILSYLRYTLSL